MWNTANAAFGVANTANSLSRGAFSLANTTSTTVSTQTGYINVIYPKVNAAFIQANTSFDRANGAFAAANAAGSSSTVVSAFDTANSAYGQANTNATNITSVGNFANGAFTQANTGATTATGAASYANGAFTKANTASSTATLAVGQANAAFDTANSKTYIFYQNTAPSTANTRDAWINSDTGIKYENLNGTTPLWVELGPTTAVSESPTATAAFDKANTAITTSGGTITGNLSVSGTISIASKQAVNGPAFRAYITTGQAIASAGAQVKVTFGGETFDTNSNFSSSRFTPTVEGYYQLNATVRLAGTSGTGENMLVLYKNGGEYARGTNGSGTEIGANFYSMQVSDLVYANGTTDYFEVYIQQGSGSNRDTTAGTNISYFSGVMVRGA